MYFEKSNLLCASSTSQLAVAWHCGCPLSIGHFFLPLGFFLLPNMFLYPPQQLASALYLLFFIVNWLVITCFRFLYFFGLTNSLIIIRRVILHILSMFVSFSIVIFLFADYIWLSYLFSPAFWLQIGCYKFFNKQIVFSI